MLTYTYYSNVSDFTNLRGVVMAVTTDLTLPEYLLASAMATDSKFAMTPRLHLPPVIQVDKSFYVEVVSSIDT